MDLDNMDVLRLCGGLAPIKNEASYAFATQEDHANTPNNVSSRRKKRSIGNHSKFWAQHRTLKIGFFIKDEKFIKLIKSAINMWTPHINLNIEFIEKAVEADIRISNSTSSQGDWSCIGTDALARLANEATMHFDTTNKIYDDEDWTSVILHEFGHALGLEHEHQHPDAKIDWNTAGVYRECAKQGWTKEITHHNIFRRLGRSTTTLAPYDPRSIMHYGFPEFYLWKTPTIFSNFTLSEKDISLIKSIYPK